MFENIIAQKAAVQLKEDILSRTLAPSMLFFGPQASGKGSAALELARILSCEGSGVPVPAPWNCPCPACTRHRSLLHTDLLALGPRSFAAEIAASRAAFLRDPSSQAAGTLFIRSLRKLLARFSPVLWEDDPARLGKLTPLLQSLEEELDEFEAHAGAQETEKLTDSILKNAFKLEDEGVSDLIPIAQLRRAAYWGRLAPNGRRKTLLIENADHMQEGARNSLLKILEEPPLTLSIILTVRRREAVMPTILSRLRPYRFLRREDEAEKEVIRRVFRDSASGPVSVYLDSFLPQSAEKLYPLAAFFIASAARAAVLSFKKRRGGEIPAGLAVLGSRSASIAEAAGFGRLVNARDVTGTVLQASANFEARSFPRFLKSILDLVSQIERESGAGRNFIAYNDIWRKCACDAETAAGVLNQSPALALESFFYRLKEALSAV